MVQGSSSPPPVTLGKGSRFYGHRVLIASLFLPDTVTFHEIASSIDSPPNQSDAPPSPTSDDQHHHLSVDELGSRLAGVSAAFKERDGETGQSPTMGERQKQPMEPPNFVASPGSLPPRKESSTIPSQPPRLGPHLQNASSPSASSSSSGGAKSQINMTKLMAEASRRPPHPHQSSSFEASSSSSSRKRDEHGGNQGRASALDTSKPTLSSSVADHGRGMGGSGDSKGAGGPASGNSTTNPRPALARGVTAHAPSTPSSLAIPSHRRRGSSSTGTDSGPSILIGPSSSLNSSSQLGASPKKSASDLSGNKTPGVGVSGKSSTLQPLSIIGDLQARQSQLTVPSNPAPDDAERHHPFGGGAVTPYRSGTTPGNPSRTPGVAHGAHTPSVLSKAPQKAGAVAASRAVPGLTMTKASEPVSSISSTSAARKAKAGTASSTNASPLPSPVPGGDDGPSPLLAPKPVLAHRLSSKTLSAVASGSFNDHGRGGQRGDEESKPEMASWSFTPKQSQTSHSHKTVSYTSDNDSGTASPSDRMGSQTLRSSRFNGTGGSSSKPSSPRYTRASSRRRRTTSVLGRKGRRPSQDYLPSFAEADDDYGNYEDAACDDLPPHSFTSNPSSNGGLVNAIACLSEQRKIRSGGRLYIGTPGFHADEGWLRAHHRRTLQQEFRDERSSVPVWVGEETFRGAYHRFCKGILWPTFHYTLPTDKALELEHEAFECYRDVNILFAKKIAEEWKEGDIVLINDYHLLLVPQLLRELVPSATIGLFIHIAFPSSELFRCLAMRETLLRGMLGADLVGFQTHNFCRHFRQTVSRILQLEATPKGVQTETSFTTVSPFPIGIDPRNLNAKRSDPEVAEWVTKLSERYEGKKVIVGRDKLDWIRGVRQKLLAFEIFLKEHPEWVGKVVLIQVALATNEENDEAGAANDVVSRINSRYASLTYQPVVFLHVQDITFSQYLALLTVADAFMANSLREGMNLTTHEYIICQEEKQSPLILSEFTGTYSALRACISINPWNTKQVAHAIHKALSMPKEEQEARWADLHRTVVTQTALQWITSLLSRLERAHIEQQRRDNAFIPKLEIGQLVSEWRASKTRLLLLDLEGSLLPNSTLLLRGPEDLKFSEPLISTLRELSEDPRNATYVLTALSTDFLDHLAEQLPGLGIVAEDGCAVKHPGRGEWISLIAGLNSAWKASVIEILKYFQDRTPGSFLHDRGATLFFSTGQLEEGQEDADQSCDHYHPTHDSASDPIAATRSRSQESQWARRQLAEINNLVFDSLGERFSLRIIPRGTTLTVSPKNVSRASAVQHIVQLQAMGVLSRVPETTHPSPPELEVGPEDSPASLSSPALLTSSLANQHQTHHHHHHHPLPRRDSEWSGMVRNCTIGSEAFSPRTSTGNPQDGSSSSSAALSRGKVSQSQSQSQSLSARSQELDSSKLRSRLPSSTTSTFLGPTGNFDFAMYIGSDERLIAYVASLDLPFAPLTVTTANIDLRGSEAGFCLPVGKLGCSDDDDDESNDGDGDGDDGGDGGRGRRRRDLHPQEGKTQEGRDKDDDGHDRGDNDGYDDNNDDESTRGGGQVLEALKELVAFRRRDMRWGRSGNEI